MGGVTLGAWLIRFACHPCRPIALRAVGEEVPAREAGDVTAAALEQPNLLAPLARLKLLHGGLLAPGSPPLLAGVST